MCGFFIVAGAEHADSEIVEKVAAQLPDAVGVDFLEPLEIIAVAHRPQARLVGGRSEHEVAVCLETFFLL